LHQTHPTLKHRSFAHNIKLLLLLMMMMMMMLPQVDLLLLAPLRIIMGASVAVCYIRVGGFTYPWLQAMGTQLCSYCISVAVDMRYRSIYLRRRAEEAVRLKAAGAGGKAAAKLAAVH